MELLDKFITVANIINPDFIIVTGDLIHDYTRFNANASGWGGQVVQGADQPNHPPMAEEKYRNYLEGAAGFSGIYGFNSPTFSVGGNHDFYGYSTDGYYMEKSQQWNTYLGKRVYGFSYGDTRVLASNDYLGDSEVDLPENALMSGLQGDVLKSYLSENGYGKLRIWAKHNYEDIDTQFINSEQIDIIINGHDHNPHHEYIGENKVLNIRPGVVCRSGEIDNWKKRLGFFRMFTIEGEDYSFSEPLRFCENPTVSYEDLHLNLRLEYTNPNDGLFKVNQAIIYNQLNENFSDCRIRFIMPKGNYQVSNGYVYQTFDNEEFSIVDVNVDVEANKFSSVVIYEKNESIPNNHIAYRKPVSTDSQEADNPVTNIVDGDINTRWASKDNDSHWVQIDLEREYFLNALKIFWYYPNSSRYYQYTVAAGDENEVFEQIIDRTDNTQGCITEDEIVDEIGRYLKLQVTKSSKGYPSIHEIEVYGWTMESNVYTIDLRSQTITIPHSESSAVLLVSDFLDNIIFYGNQEHSVQSASNFLQEGYKLLVVDYNNEQLEFNIKFKDTDAVVSRNKPVFSSGEEGVSDDGEITLAAYVNDDDLSTRWAAPKRNGKAYYPEWIIIDLENLYDIDEVELYFYKHGENNRAYSYEVWFSDHNTTADEHFYLVSESKNNVNKSGYYQHFYQNQKARYVKVNVTDCSLTQSWAAASINELIVKANHYTVSVDQLNETSDYHISHRENNLYIKAENPLAHTQLDIFDISGQKITAQTFLQEYHSTIEKGIYLITFTNLQTQISEIVKYIVW